MNSTTFTIILYYPTLLEIGLFYLFSYILMEILNLSMYRKEIKLIGGEWVANYSPIYIVFLPWRNHKGIWMGLFALIIYPFLVFVAIYSWFRMK